MVRHKRQINKAPINTFAVLCAFFSPVVAAWRGVARLAISGTWSMRLIAVSVAGNMVFLATLAIAFFSDTDNSWNPRLVAPSCETTSDTRLAFCKAVEGSYLASTEPEAVYVAYNGIIVTRYEFRGKQKNDLDEITISDRNGRPWIDINLEAGSLIYHRYEDAMHDKPSASLRDKDGDGIPDIMINWDKGISYARDAELSWRPIAKH